MKTDITQLKLDTLEPIKLIDTDTSRHYVYLYLNVNLGLSVVSHDEISSEFQIKYGIREEDHFDFDHTIDRMNGETSNTAIQRKLLNIIARAADRHDRLPLLKDSEVDPSHIHAPIRLCLNPMIENQYDLEHLKRWLTSNGVVSERQSYLWSRESVDEGWLGGLVYSN